MCLYLMGKAEVVSWYDTEVPTARTVYILPAVLRLNRSHNVYRPAVRFSRANIFARDGFTCQYCGERRTSKELTYDHLLPKSRGGRTEWTNIVTCCIPCNLRKDDHTPDECGMRLLRPPVKPRFLDGSRKGVHLSSPPQQWLPWLPWIPPASVPLPDAAPRRAAG